MHNNNSIARILLVEDESGHAELIRRALENSAEKYDVAVVSTLNDAQHSISLHTPDIVLVDYRLPDGQGDAMISLGKRAFPVVMLTSHGDEQLAVQMIKAGALDYITKSPESFNHMPHVVDRALREWHSMQGRKDAEDALRQSEDMFKCLVKDMSVGVLVQGPHAEILLSNATALVLLGISEDQLLGKTSFDPDWNVIHEDGSDFPGATHPVPMAIASRQAVTKIVMGVYRPDTNDRVWLLVGAVPQLNSDGTVKQVVCTFIDITERKHAEEELHETNEYLQNLVNYANAPIIVWDPLLRITRFNHAFELLTGHSEADVLGRSLELLFPPELSEHSMELIRQTSSGERWETVEIKIVHRDGTVRTVLWNSATLFAPDGRTPIATIAQGQDITERIIAEQLVRDMQRRESIGILSAGIAHDFNNLLGSMMGNVSFAQSQMPLHHPAIKNMEKSLVAMERAAQLTQQMLAYSGKGKFQFCTMDVRAIISERVSMLKMSLSTNVQLTTQLPDAPVYINGDPVQIEQIITNLTINGGEAIGGKQGIVSILLKSATIQGDDLSHYGKITNITLGEGPYVVLEVKDTGVGMSQETLHKIFDPFFTTKFVGRGLGLSAVLGIIQGHKGGITVESTEGFGTTFRVILPTVLLPAIAEEPANEKIQLQGVKPTTILVIDDEEDIATMAQEILETEKYTILVELNPILGVELFKKHHAEIDLVLLDLTMPQMSGKDVVVALQAIDPNIKIIITSGYSEGEVKIKLGASNVSGFMEKPFRMKKILAMVRSVLEMS